jgi:hypothetical protein
VWQVAVAQPFNREQNVPQPGKIDEKLGEFWVPNAWLFPDYRKNLSSYERNRVFLNRGNLHFADISHLSGADSEGDGRSSVAADLSGDGMLDLLVRQTGGGSLLIFENRFPRKHWLQVSLQGTKSNSEGIGARLVLKVAGHQQTREMYPANTFRSQSPCRIHFGLGDARRANRLTVYWPSGAVDVHRDLAADRHVIIKEGSRSLLPSPRSLQASAPR